VSGFLGICWGGGGVAAERQIAGSWLVVAEKCCQDSVAKQHVGPFSVKSEGI